MKNRLFRFSASVALLLAGSVAYAADINGAGATFPAPAYEKWGDAYHKSHPDFSLHYQGLGSGAGIKQIQSKIVDFGASDVPMSAEDLAANGFTQFPTLVGAVVPVVNLANIQPGQISLSGEVLADIYLGKITQWNDPRIAADNKGLKLPDQRINVVYRSDQSGTAAVFTSYLSQVSPEWRRNVGAGTSVQWPVGVGGKGNEGAASYVRRLPGGIGFVEYATVMQDKLCYVQMKNRDGQTVAPSEASVKAAAAHANWNVATGFGESLVNQPGKDSWPIATATFILTGKVQVSAERGKSVLQFFGWALRDGAQVASQLGYVPLPDNVVKMVLDAWKDQVKDASGRSLWP